MMVLLRICVSIYAIKMLAKETAVFVPIVVPWVVFSIELERIVFRINPCGGGGGVLPYKRLIGMCR